MAEALVGFEGDRGDIEIAGLCRVFLASKIKNRVIRLVKCTGDSQAGPGDG